MDLEPIRALLELANAAPGQLATEFDPDRKDTPVMVYSDADNEVIAKFIMQASRSIPALSQLLEAVSNLEKLEAEWRDGLPGMSDGEREIYIAYRKGCADDLKRLLHPEDK